MGGGNKADSADKQRAARWLVCLLALGSMLGLASAAMAAPAKPKQITPPKLTQPMRVVIVRDSRPGCAPDCAEWISAQGQITEETPDQFRRVFKALGAKKLPIFISSPGGKVNSAMAIGREIRKRGLDVAVERTIFQQCEVSVTICDLAGLKDGDKGRPELAGAGCSSACVLILAAGKERLVPEDGFVGVHRHHGWQTWRQVLRTVRIQKRIVNRRIVEHREVIAEKEVSRRTVETEPDYAPTRAYYTEMGIDTAVLMPLLLGTPHTGVHRMTPDERRATRIVTREARGDALLPVPSHPADPKPDTGASVALGFAAPPEAGAVLIPVYPPNGQSVELVIRMRASGPRSLTPRFVADILFASGKKLVATSTGTSPTDPLYAALKTRDFCALRRNGKLAMRILIRDAMRPDQPIMITADLARDERSATFAGLHCPTVALPFPAASQALPVSAAGAATKPVPAKN